MSSRRSIWTRARNRWSPDRSTWADHAAERHRVKAQDKARRRAANKRARAARHA